ncbi:ATP-binding cassette domain-containing protein [Streptomyces sp. NPDC001728]|uniref:ATP-binding cassette domain-containing protein n=1 Tax=Streptomyces sp. NPDC001728 TaxID=3154396 RepID=UPI0033210B1F
MTHAIEAEGLRRAYSGGFEAVRGLTFTVPRGEIFALLGTNGAGKTSTVELLEGLAAPSAGRMRSRAGPTSDRCSGIALAVELRLKQIGEDTHGVAPTTVAPVAVDVGGDHLFAIARAVGVGPRSEERTPHAPDGFPAGQSH